MQRGVAGAARAQARARSARRVVGHVVEVLEEGPGRAVGVDGWRAGRMLW